MIKRIKIENYRSFVKAEAEIQPFTLVIGANGAGKSNLLRAVEEIAFGQESHRDPFRKGRAWNPHILHQAEPGSISVMLHDGDWKSINSVVPKKQTTGWLTERIPLFNLSPIAISREETVIPKPTVKANGEGTTQVLDFLKNGNREDLFDQIEENFRCYVPEVEKLSLLSTGEGKKVIQIREKGLDGKALPASELSEGTRLILCILTIIHQENPPPVILLEDIDRGMHPRLFERIAPLMRQIAEEHDINILATTHNPYLVDAFQDAKESVLIVEKVDGASVLVPLIKRLEELDYDKEEAHVSLGELWYSGLVGGVPLRAKL